MKVIKTIVGLSVILIVLSLFFGINAAELFYYSVICTLGVSLWFWIPLGYCVGYIVVEIIFFGWPGQTLGKKSAETTKPPGPQKSTVQSLTERLNQELWNDPTLSRNRSALFNYIKKARTKGLNDEQISQNLKTNGWTTDSITAAFQMARNG